MRTVSNLILFAIFAVVVEEVTAKYVLVEINDGEEKGNVMLLLFHMIKNGHFNSN